MGFTIPNEADAGAADQAEIDKVDIDILVAALTGTGVLSGGTVTAQGTPDGTVAVAAGTAKAGTTFVTIGAGNVTVGNGHATLPRFDLIVVDNAGSKSCTAGTAAANAVFPAIPANSVVLAAVYRPPTATTVTTSHITDKRCIIGASTILTSFINEVQGADIASASTTDLGAATGNYIDVTGTTTITALGTVQAGTRRIVRFTGALTLTHNATSLILPGGANITTVAGDTAVFVSLGSGNWRCTSYTKVTVTGSGSAVLATSPTLVTPALGTPASGVLKNCTGISRVVTFQVTDPNGAVLAVGDGQAYFRVPALMTGYDLIAVAAHVTTVSSSGIPTVQIANVTDSVDMLSTKLTIDASEKDSSTAATAAVIDTTKDDVVTGDELRIDVDVAGTGTKGLIVQLTFGQP